MYRFVKRIFASLFKQTQRISFSIYTADKLFISFTFYPVVTINVCYFVIEGKKGETKSPNRHPPLLILSLFARLV